MQSNVQLRLINKKSVKIIIYTALQNKFTYAWVGGVNDINHTSEQILNVLNNKYFSHPNKKYNNF